ncbi:hypothetical protein CONPUDRAFT_169516 [Coniophora puteana RWD-64-598 SS2]|uniref:Uncharacterized protein n=1 Tax=Coniophora puteana (strain RWD-64-598) TaxID=741705 RepID=A0A5M3M7R9_CONPW|nr:uncharacterized protein CONPUDRAFT_169516 [Coniophora puteana RWD-64-598 SS2]EIW75087.1 hypothetical protein CONPUDRAFT_169516 [Coniophora puteana RWD-64-598 SS2]
MAMLETPSRIWRRIEAADGDELPSLPSLPAFDQTQAPPSESEESSTDDNDNDDHNNHLLPVHSTPAPSSHGNTATFRLPPSSASSTARFASSIGSRSLAARSSASSTSRGMPRSVYDSFDISVIPSQPHRSPTESEEHDLDRSNNSVPELHLPPEEDDVEERELSLTDALEPLSRSNSPPLPLPLPQQVPSSKRTYDYSVSLRTEPKASPFDKFRNVAMRRPVIGRTRTPSLSRTTPSPASSPANSTPRSALTAPPRSPSPTPAARVPLPRSATASPAASSFNNVTIQGPAELSMTEGLPDALNHLHEDLETDEDRHAEGETQADDEMQREEEGQTEDERQTEDPSEPSQQQTDSHEPTFSSNSDPSYPPYNRSIASPYARSNASPALARSPALSNANASPAFARSPAPSTAVPSPGGTPASIVTPRPRPRFNIPAMRSELDSDEHAEQTTSNEEQLTPHTRRRSFLLSVINSTARPRMKFPTPHHRRISGIGLEASEALHETEEDEEEGEEGEDAGPVVDANETPSVPMRTLPGITPKPALRRARFSAPITQAYIPENTMDGVGAGGRDSPVHSDQDRNSFVSTASSHDLTTHPRANTSYDPALGLGERGGVGRFDAARLNSYLHGLNKRLQEENIALLERLRKFEDVKDGDAHMPRLSLDNASVASASSRKRRISAGGALGDVEETSAEGWAEEKRELEEMAEELAKEADKLAGEKEDAEKDLEDERAARARDKERWKERMLEVENGVADIIGGLEGQVKGAAEKLKAAEEEREALVKAADKEIAKAGSERDIALHRAEKAEEALSGNRGELGGSLREANGLVGKLQSELSEANAQVKTLDGELKSADNKIEDLEAQLKHHQSDAVRTTNDLRSQLEDAEIELAGSAKKVSSLERELTLKQRSMEHLQTELQAMSDELEGLRSGMGKGAQEAASELRDLRAYVVDADAAADVAAQQIEALEGQLTDAEQRLHAAEAECEGALERADMREREAEREKEAARQVEAALEAAEHKMRADEDALVDLRGRLTSLEREREREREVSRVLREQNHTRGSSPDMEDALEAELDEANHEIARLNALMQQSPARRAIDKAKDVKIDILERERDELLERLKTFRGNAMDAAAFTPQKPMNMSGMSPLHRHVLNVSLKAPKTPGGPLKDLTWLNATTNDPSVSPLLAEIARLQTELDRANENIDDKLDKLEDAGLGVIGLTRNLEDARTQIAALESEVNRLKRREERRARRLARLHCRKCLVKVDGASIERIMNPDESSFELSYADLPASTSPAAAKKAAEDALTAELQAVNVQLRDLQKEWQREKEELLGENAVLQDAAERLNNQVRTAMKRAASIEKASLKTKESQSELDKARDVIAELEAGLQAERTRLRQLSAEQDRVQRQRSGVSRQLDRTEADIDEVRRQLTKAKEENKQLENELRYSIKEVATPKTC